MPTPTERLYDFKAAVLNDREQADAMLSAEPDLIRGHLPNDETVLHYLVVENNLDAVQWLISRGASVNATHDESETPLADATGLDHPEMVKLLLSHGADPNGSGYCLGTPLERADNVEIVDLLLAAGADVNRGTSSSGPPLHAALESGRRAVAERLIQAGASTTSQDRWGRLPLHAAAESGDAELLAWFIGLGMDPKVIDGTHSTALHAAASVGADDSVRLLLKLGVDSLTLNEYGETAAQLAKRMNHPATAELLETLRD